MKLLCDWRRPVITGLVAAVILGQGLALAYLWRERTHPFQAPEEESVCAPTPILMEVLKELEVQGPVWRGDSALKQDTVLFANGVTGQYYLVRGSLEGHSCILDGGRAVPTSPETL